MIFQIQTIILILTLVLINLQQISNQCVHGNQLQDTEKYPDTYCGSLIDWPITSGVLNSFAEGGDLQAFTLYTNLYKKWKAQGEGKSGDSTSNPTNDCLGIARAVFCAHSFPYCSKGEEDPGVCDFLCDLWIDRCPDEKELHKTMCSTQRASKCSYSILQQQIQWILILLIIFLLA